MKKLLVLVLALAVVIGAIFAVSVSAADAANVASADIAKLYEANGSEVVGGGFNGGDGLSEVFDGSSVGLYQNTAGRYIIIDLSQKLAGGYQVTDVKVTHAGNCQYSLYYTVDGVTWNPIVEKTSQKGGTFAVNAVATQIKYVFDTTSNWAQSLGEIEVYGVDPAELSCLHTNMTENGWVNVENSATCTTIGNQSQTCPDCGEVFVRESASIPALGHNLISEVTKEGTSTEYGSGKIYCSRCDFVINFDGEVNLADPYYLGYGDMLKFVNIAVSSIAAESWGSSPDNMTDGNLGTGYLDAWASASDDDENEYALINFQFEIDLTKLDIWVMNAPNSTLRISALNSETGEYEIIKEINAYDETIEERGTLAISTSLLGVSTTSLKLQVISDYYHQDGGWTHGHMVISEVNPYGMVKGCGLKAEEHVHDYSILVETIVKATCLTDGTSVYKCICNDQKTVTVTAIDPENGHNYVAGEAAENGAITYTCSKCEDAYVVNNSLINGTYYDSTMMEYVFADGVLTANGLTLNYTYNVTTGFVTTDNAMVSFNVSDGVIYFNRSERLHQHTGEGYAAEEQEDGSINYVCTFCGEVQYVVNNAAINGTYYDSTMMEYVFADGVLTANGLTLNYTYNVTTGFVTTDNAMVSFNVSDGVIYFNRSERLHQHTGEGYAAEEQEDGSINYVCTFCGEVQYVVNNAAINGTYYMDGSELVFADGVLTIDGETTLNYTYNVTTGMVDTDNAAINFTVRDGKVYFKGATELHQADHAEHDASIIPTYETFAPTCSEAGYTEYYCYCGYSFKVEGEPALGGECIWYFQGYDEYDMPSCGVKGGTEIYACPVCNATKTVYQEATHRFIFNMGSIEGKGPTCTEPGYAKFECNNCSEYVERLVPAQHSYEQNFDTYQAPTCTVDGSVVNVCSVCGDSYTEELPANGHNPKWQYDSTTATCTEAGIEYYGCWNCDAIIEVEVDAYGHTFVIDETTLDLDAHTVDKVCSTCNATESVSSLGMKADPYEFTISGEETLTGEIVANANENYTYYKVVLPDGVTEGYLTIVVNSDNSYCYFVEANEKYDSQYGTMFEMQSDGTYLLAVSTNYGEETITVTATFEKAVVPNKGETAEKAVQIEFPNEAHTSTGTFWYYYQASAGKLTINVTSGTATSIKYGTDAEKMVEYTGTFNSEDWTTYYILVESDEAVEIVLDYEAPVGTMDNPLSIVVGQNNVVSTNGGWATFYASYNASANGTLTVNFDSTTYANVVIYVGTHPYQMYTSVTDGTTIEVSAWTTYYFGITTSDEAPVEFIITASFEEAEAGTPEAPTPDDNVGDKIGSIEVTTSDTYGYHDMYTYTADKAGKYTFAIPVGVGFYSKTQYDAWGPAEIDFNEAVGGYVTVTLEAGEAYSFYVGAFTKDTWTIDVYYVEAHTHEYTIVASEDSTCTVKGYIAYECSCGDNYVETLELAAHTETEIPMVRPTPSKTGYTAGVECSECGTIIKAPVEIVVVEMSNGTSASNIVYRIASASLTLQENISVNYKTIITEGYNAETAYMVFEFLGVEYIVTESRYSLSEDRYIFNFNKTNPQFMNENIAAYLYAETAEGEYTVVNVAEYSVKQYCEKQLAGDDAGLKTVVSDVLTYGAAVQVYLGHKVDELITDIVKADGYTLTPTEFTEITGCDKQKVVTGNVEADTAWKSAALSMGSATELVAKFASNSSLEGLKIKVMIDGYDEPVYFDANECTYEYNDDGELRYIFKLGIVRSYEYDNKITLTFERDGVQVGGTLEYSINTYLQKNYTKTSLGDATINVMKALYVYGSSVANYFSNK